MTAIAPGTAVDAGSPNGHAPHRYEAIPRPSPTATETAMVGIAMTADYAALLAAIDQYGITEDSFSLPGHGVAFAMVCEHRAESDGRAADPVMVLARLTRRAEEEGATRAYGIGAVQLHTWAAESMPVNLDFYAWTLAEYAYGRDVRGSVATATGRLADTRDAGSVSRWLIGELGRLDAAHTGTRVVTGSGLTRAAENAFWTATPVLARIRQAAWSRMAPAWATLGCVLVRVIAATPPEYQLPDIIGDYASLNGFLAIPGASGEGKGLAMGAARRYIDVGQIDKINIGTGEGMAKSYVEWVANPDEPGGGHLEQIRVSMMFDCSEVDNLSAIAGRKGATITGTLRQAWMGEELGAGNSTKELRLQVPEHTYRATLVVGVQPGSADVLLNDKETRGGTPQRFLWTPATDPLIPDPRHRPDKPPGMVWEMPPWPTVGMPFVPGVGRYVIPVCRAVEDAVLGARHARLNGAGDALDGHALLNREKWAAALALIHGVVGIDDFFWELSGVLMQVSDFTRRRLVEEQDRAREAQDRKRAESYAVARVMADDKVESECLRRTTRAILARLEKFRADRGPDAWMAGNDLTHLLRAKTQRPYFDEVMPGLLSTGQVESKPIEYNGVPGVAYRQSATSR